MVHSKYVPSQWDTALLCNAISLTGRIHRMIPAVTKSSYAIVVSVESVVDSSNVCSFHTITYNGLSFSRQAFVIFTANNVVVAARLCRYVRHSWRLCSADTGNERYIYIYICISYLTLYLTICIQVFGPFEKQLLTASKYRSLRIKSFLAPMIWIRISVVNENKPQFC